MPERRVTVSDEHTGSMIAFLPSDPHGLAVDGGDPPSELHVTCVYMGDDHAAFTAQDRHATAVVLELLGHGPVQATVTAVQTLGSNEPPATVMMLDAPELHTLRGRIKTALVNAGVPVPEDTYPEYLPHLTLGYGLDPAEHQHRVGEIITLDRVGAWYGPEHTEIDMKEDSRMGGRFYAVIARMGVPTGDRRILAPGSISNRTLPLPLMWQERQAPGHDGAVVIGRIDTIDTDEMGTVTAFGELLDESVIPDVAKAKELIRNGVLGCSIDPGMVEWEELPDGWMMFNRYEIGGFTALPIAAFSDTPIVLIGEDLAVPGDGGSEDSEELYDGDDYGWLYALTAAVTSEGLTGLPVAGTAVEWDGDAAAQRVAEWAGVDAEDAGEGVWQKYGRAFLLRDDDADPMTRAAYKLGVADVVDGELTLIPRAVYAVASVLAGGRGGVDAPQEEQERLKGAVRSLYERIADSTGEDVEVPFSLTAAAPKLPPLALFQDPGFTGPTPISVKAQDGFLRITGHIGLHGARHRGLPGHVTIPKSMSGYREFLLGATPTAEGIAVPTGPVTMGGGHADTGLGMRAAAEHYDNVATKVAAVTAGDDAFGVWISGVIKDGVTEAQIVDLMESPPSGDWRADESGNLELITVHAVNVPGFAVYRVGMNMESQQAYALVASADFAGAADAVTLDLDGDLRAQFDAAGVAWPTITVEFGGRVFEPYPVAEGCVRAAVGGAVGPEPVELVADGRERLRAAARLRLALSGV